MLETSVKNILAAIKDQDVVLDIGGWARPFNRANYILDLSPFETRGMFGSQGPINEHFNSETWIVRDICDRAPYPFPDKFFDFVICSHTLEDIRDPIWVCSEIVRIGKRGYIEVPSLVSELAFGMENSHYAGRNHHRWLIEINENEIVFTFKYHHIHSNTWYHIPNRVYRRINQPVQYLLWENTFQYMEQVLVTNTFIDEFLSSRVKSYYSYPFYYETLELFRRKVGRILRGLL